MEQNHNRKPLRVVASFTTLPDRYSLLKKSIESIINPEFPLDAIYLTVPTRALRLNKEYPPIPDDISSLCTVIRTEFDYGPIMKIYGALVSENDPDTIIVTCDDDMIYDKNLIQKMVIHHNDYPNVAICGTGALIGKGFIFYSMVNSIKTMRRWNGLTGFSINKEGREIDLIFGYAGVLYKRGFFPEQEQLYDELFRYSVENNDIYLNDDILLSGFLNKNNIKMKIFNDIPDVKCQGSKAPDALSYSYISSIMKLNDSIDHLKSHGFFQTTEPVSIDDSVIVRIGFAVVIAIIILLLCWGFYLYLEKV